MFTNDLALHDSFDIGKDIMKFIGIPRAEKDKGEKVRSVIGGVLLFSVVLISVLGAESLFSGPRSIATTDEADLSQDVVASEAVMPPANVDESLPSLADRSDEELALGMNISPDTVVDGSTGSHLPYNVYTAIIAKDAPGTGSPETEEVSPATAPTETTVAVTESEENAHFYIIAELSVRKGPGTEYEKVSSFQAGDEVDTVASTSNGWKKLSDGTYIIDDYLSVLPPEVVLEGTYYVTGEVNVRSGPGTQYDVVKTLVKGDAISVAAETSNGWYRTVKGTYVSKEVCSATPPATPTPVPTPKPTATPTPKPKATPTPKPTSAPVNPPDPGTMTLLGDYKITFYGPTGHTTNSGTECIEGQTIAVDKSIIPLGTKIYIENDPLGGDGYYIAEDTGSAVKGNIIDIFAEDGESRGTLTGVKVYIVN